MYSRSYIEIKDRASYSFWTVGQVTETGVQKNSDGQSNKSELTGQSEYVILLIIYVTIKSEANTREAMNQK